MSTQRRSPPSTQGCLLPHRRLRLTDGLSARNPRPSLSR